MAERIIAHWPPPHADEDKIEDTEREIFTAVRSQLLERVKGKKKSRIQGSSTDQLMYEMSGSMDEEITLCLGILKKSYDGVLGELHEGEVSQLINEKLKAEVRAQLAYVLVWSFVYDLQDNISFGYDSDCCEGEEEEEDDEEEDQYGLGLWTPPEEIVLPDLADEALTDRAQQLELLNAVDAQTNLRNVYRNIIFGQYGHQNGENNRG